VYVIANTALSGSSDSLAPSFMDGWRSTDIYSSMGGLRVRAQSTCLQPKKSRVPEQAVNRVCLSDWRLGHAHTWTVKYLPSARFLYWPHIARHSLDMERPNMAGRTEAGSRSVGKRIERLHKKEFNATSFSAPRRV
jgi:hypothetical protein